MSDIDAWREISREQNAKIINQARRMQELRAENERLHADAERYRWLRTMMQRSHDGEMPDADAPVSVECGRVFNRRDSRCMRAELRWFDKRGDASLNLDAAIDDARKEEAP